MSNKKIVNKRYDKIGLGSNYHVTVLRIRRSGIEISPKPSSILRFGDKLRITGDRTSLDSVKKLLGNDTKTLSNTDFLPIALGVLIGIFLGMVVLPLGSISFSLGMTGGTLLAAILLSRLGKTGPIIWSMSGNANQLLRELGLLLFMAAVGTKAGVVYKHHSSIRNQSDYHQHSTYNNTDNYWSFGWPLYFKINFLSLLGVITGAMTSTPGLAVVNSKSDTNAAPIAYATVYPVALVFIILVSQILPKL
ncbi:MAG: hypothetical protein HC831_31750 [Chloroflexia bacterium]|nr:hypothetical protein [Chloroflexia bacterium]